MPFGIHKHSNRSKQALNDPVGQPAAHNPSNSSAAVSPNPNSFASGIDDPNQVPAGQQQQHQHHQYSPQESYSQSVAPDSPDSRSFLRQSSSSPSRSQSTRYPGPYHQHQHQQSPQSQSGRSVDDLLDTRNYQQQQAQALQGQQSQQQNYPQPLQLQPPQTQTQVPAAAPEPPPEQHKKSKSIFDRMRSGRENRLSQEVKPVPTSYNASSVLARKLSKRQENPPTIRTVPQQQQGNPLEERLHSARQSRSQLPSPQESSEHNSDLDPFQIQEQDQRQPHSSVQELGQHQTIRPILNDQEPTVYPPNEDSHSQFAPHPPPHSPHISYRHNPEAGAQGQYELQNQGPPQQNYNLQPGINFTSDPYRQQNPETVSQLSYDSPIEQREEQQQQQQQQQQQRPISVQSNGQSPTNFSNRPQYPDRTSSIQGPRPNSQVAIPMAPPTGASQQNRRSAADPKNMQGAPGQSEGAPPPTYTRGSSFPGNQPPTQGLSPLPSAVGTQGQGPNYRGGHPQRDQYGATGGEQGRSTPPPQPAGQDVAEAYKELQIKYKKVKGLYFDKTAQVEQLQNTLANQRLSQSRTSLDDSEYMTRFQRLDGATTNLAFNIRKDWRSVPAWLSQSVNQDALKIGKQEMTAVGRACITKFLVDEIFCRTFHPGLESGLSHSLKSMEQNIRRFSPALNNQEESDALTAKVVQWRLATLEGLRDVLNSPESEEHRRDFARAATTNLTAVLINYLQDPMPPGIEDSAHMIVELAVSIACNLPLESRDISISYPMPGDVFQPFLMKVETGIPSLENPGADTDDNDSASTGSGDREESQKENEKNSKPHKEKTKSGGSMLQAMMGAGSAGPGVKKQSISSQGGVEGPGGDAKGKLSEDGAQKVRFAGFISVEVRGRQVLGKAPVWTVG